MGEWLKPAVLKTVCGATRTGVRIPLPPPYFLQLRSVPRIGGALPHGAYSNGTSNGGLEKAWPSDAWTRRHCDV